MNAVLADDDREAARLFTSVQQRFLATLRGRMHPLDPPVDDMHSARVSGLRTVRNTEQGGQVQERGRGDRRGGGCRGDRRRRVGSVGGGRDWGL